MVSKDTGHKKTIKMLAYFLKMNVAIALFYAFYRLFFYKDTFFGWRRTALLCFFAVSAVYPLLNIQEWITEQEPMVTMAGLYANVMPEFIFTPQAEIATDWKALLTSYAHWIYWGVALALLIRFFIQLTCILRLVCQCKVVKNGRNTLCLLSKPASPFSFFHWIFIHPASHTEEEYNEILTHEETHVRQWHSLDVMVGEIACILCWFNPFAWLLKREVRTNLEYMADARVLENGYDSKTYQYHLLGLSHHKAAANIYNNFNVLPLKKRIKMMNKKRTKEIGRTKYFIFLPLAALLLIISNIEIVARTTKEIADDVRENVAARLEQPLPALQDTAIAGRQIFEVTEVMPAYPGGFSACMKFLSENLKYPKEAVEKGIQGRVVVQYIVNEDGNISNIKVLKGCYPSLDAEAVRVIASMPKWTPGMQKGKAVAVKYTMPVVFSLQSSKKSANAGYDPAKAEPDANGVYEVAEVMPEFPGGTGALMQYITKNFQYPAEAQKKGVQGKVIVQMIIDSEGNVTKAKVLQGVDPLLDAEALRLTNAMPRWKPGTQKGKAVPVKYTCPFMFRLQ